jgi:hypothetical protein
MAIKIVTCTCGHPAAQHEDGTGACKEPTGRCICPFLVELCPMCRHSRAMHVDGACTRVKMIDRTMCGCSYYPSPLPDAS